MKDVEVIQVVRTTLTRRGEGRAPDDPVRRITQFWSLNGELLAESGPWLEIEQPQTGAVGRRDLMAVVEPCPVERFGITGTNARWSEPPLDPHGRMCVAHKRAGTAPTAPLTTPKG